MSYGHTGFITASAITGTLVQGIHPSGPLFPHGSPGAPPGSIWVLMEPSVGVHPNLQSLELVASRSKEEPSKELVCPPVRERSLRKEVGLSQDPGTTEQGHKPKTPECFWPNSGRPSLLGKQN